MSLDKTTIRRLASDVKSLKLNSLESDNIYYKHDEENILKGYALIIGSKNTPYSYGAYLFEFIFPNNYPFSPPTLKYLTNDGYTRFNPNLYTNGKVCLSVLNTWNGEGWSSCQSIRSILLILSTILNEYPLLNEPGIKKKDSNVDKYNLLISYKNIEFSILKQIKYIIDEKKESSKKCNYINILELFRNNILLNFNKNHEFIKNNINNLEKLIKDDILYVRTYNLNISIDFQKLIKKYNSICHLIKDYI